MIVTNLHRMTQPESGQVAAARAGVRAVRAAPTCMQTCSPLPRHRPKCMDCLSSLGTRAPSLAAWFVKISFHLVKISHSFPFPSLLLLASPSTSTRSCTSSFHRTSSLETEALAWAGPAHPMPHGSQGTNACLCLTKQSHYTKPCEARLCCWRDTLEQPTLNPTLAT